MSTTHLDPTDQTSVSSVARGGLRALGGLLWRRRWVALLVFALVVNAVAAGLVIAPREYTATPSNTVRCAGPTITTVAAGRLRSRAKPWAATGPEYLSPA